jgi:hypothetical protein
MQKNEMENDDKILLNSKFYCTLEHECQNILYYKYRSQTLKNINVRCWNMGKQKRKLKYKQ